MNKSHPFSFRCVEKSNYYETKKDFYTDFKNEEESAFLFIMKLDSDGVLIFDRMSTGDIRIGDVFFDKRTNDFYVFSFHFFGERNYPRMFGFKNIADIRDSYLYSELAKPNVRFDYVGNIFQHTNISNAISASCCYSRNYEEMIKYYKEINMRIRVTTKEHYDVSINLLKTQQYILEADKNNEIWDIYFDVADIKNAFSHKVFINDYLKTGQFLVFEQKYFDEFLSKKKNIEYINAFNSLSKKDKESFQILKYLIFYFDESGLIKYKSLHNGKDYELSNLISMNPKPLISDSYYCYYHLNFDKKDYVENFLKHV